MQSAFGIDHGEISKATRAQKRTMGNGIPSKPQRVKGVLNQIGDAHVSIKGIGRASAKGIRGAGAFMDKRPGTTGAALVAGSAAVGYHHVNQRTPKKKR